MIQDSPISAPVVNLRDVDLRLSDRFSLVISELTIGAGVTAVVGANGGGKTTLLRVLATVLPAGRLTVGGIGTDDPAGLVAVRRRLGFAPQDDSVPPRLTAWDHVDVVAVMREVGGAGGDGYEARRRRRAVHRALADLDLLDVVNQRCARLSGGTRRRVALAAALAGRPDYVVLDEPTTHLDDEHREHLATLLRQGATVVVATHDRQWAGRVADRIVEIRDGRLA